MKIFKNFGNFFRKSVSIQTTSNPKSGIGHNLSFLDVLLKNGYYDLAAYVAIKYYKQAGPVATAIDIVADNLASINPIIKNAQTGKTLDQHPLLDLLQNPNADSTYDELIKRIICYFLITGTTYINADGQDNSKPPVSINVVCTDCVTPIIGNDGYPESFQTNIYSGSITYSKKVVNSRFRYYAVDATLRGAHELYQIKTFNPNFGNYNLTGLSPLQPIAIDIEQLISTGHHNLSTLKRGATITGMFLTDHELDDDQYNRLKAQINEYYVGEENSGRPFLAENGLTFAPAQQTNKDMDYLASKKQITNSIYQKLGIPLPLVSEETMTMANLEAAKIDLWHRTILPLARRIFNELNIFLMPRYPNSENLILTFDKSSIPALAAERMEALGKQKDLGIFTINELRKEFGLNSLEGGDSLYLPSNLVPIAENIEIDNA